MPEEPNNKPKQKTDRLGKYEIIGHIATGGMGKVYMARDVDLDRVVALKILPAKVAKDPTALTRFKREAKAAAQLRHENIVNIFDVGEANGHHYIALEYVDGTDLQAYIARKCRLDPNEARQLMIQATRALAHAFEQGIVHRDIKPSNFLLMFKDKRLIVKLTDFGLAIRQESDEEFRLTRDKTTVGTVDYMSPEQARDSRSADIRSDIYSLGCTFYHMLAGSAPFARGTLPERLVQHMQAAPPDMRKLNKNVPAYLVAIINRMLAKKPDDRYQTPHDLLHDLENPEQVAIPARIGGEKTTRGDVTAVIETREIDENSAEPVQVKSAPSRPKKTPVARPTKKPKEEQFDDPDYEEPADEDFDDDPPRKPAPPAREKKSGGSMLWVAGIGGSVGVLGLALVIAFAFIGRNPPEKKEPEKKRPIPIVTPVEEKKPDPDPIIDTSPSKMTVVGHPLPLMDLDPDKVDAIRVRKEFAGPFTQFPEPPDDAKPGRVGRFSTDASSYPGIAEALAQTKADQANVIEIADDGPIFLASLPAMAQRTIVLRALAGHRPQLVWDVPKKIASPKSARTFFALTQGKLILEGIDLVLKSPDETPVVVFDLVESDFYARNCTFSFAGKSPTGIALLRHSAPVAHKAQTWLQRCYVRGPEATLVQYAGGSGELFLDESLVVGHLHPLIQIRAREDDRLALHCIRSTLVVGQTLLRWQALEAKRDSPQIDGRIVDSILARDDPNGEQGDLLHLADTDNLNRMSWKASNTVYAGWKQLLSSSARRIGGTELDAWRRQWLYSSGDRAFPDYWPSHPPPVLEERPTGTFVPASSPVAFAALTGPGAIGSVAGWLPAAPEAWTDRAYTQRPVAPIPAPETETPRISDANDGFYHGERIDVTKVDLGAYLTAKLQKVKPAARVVVHLAGKGTCQTSPLRVKGIPQFVLVAEPAKDPLVLEVNPNSVGQPGPLIEATGGGLELIGVRARLSPVTFVPAIVQVTGGNLAVTRCWLQGPLAKSPDAFRSLIAVSSNGSGPVQLMLRDNVLASGKLLVQMNDVQLRARNNVLASLGDGIHIDASASSAAVTHVFEHNTCAIRQSIWQIKSTAASLPGGPTLVHANHNAFLAPFEETEKATLVRGVADWATRSRWSWQGRYNVYDARLHSYFGGAKQTLKDWQRIWGPVGEQDAQVLDAGVIKAITLEGASSATLRLQLERLALPKQLRIDPTQGPPGADLVVLDILKKKG